MRSKIFAGLSLAAAFLVAPVAARAGGPLFIDPTSLTPIRYAAGPTPIYTDLGALGPLSNATATGRVAFAWQQWTDVPTSSFQAQIAGDMTARGLTDITVANITDVIGTQNGTGIDIVYDTDGTIFQDFFGTSPSVLGIATPEYGSEGTNLITESWVVLNGAAVDPADVTGETFTGVMTHEFGHSINLGHSQVNGSTVFFSDAGGPATCGSLPYSGAPTNDDLETMYPFIDPTAGTGSGAAQSTVDMTDDIVAISNIYPAAGWPQSAGSITGTVVYPNGTTQIQGVNVVARNVVDPWHDAVSAMTGDVTRGYPNQLGKYTINGLEPGASYVLYVDGIVAGGFSIAPAPFLPGPEEFFNGPRESNNAATDAACDVEPITAVAGVPVTANIAFNATAGAPLVNVIGINLGVSDMTSDGLTMVGISLDSAAGPGYRWTAATGVQNLGGTGGSISIAADGSAIAANSPDPDNGYDVASLWQGGTNWLQLPTLEGQCEGFPSSKTSSYGVSNGGRTVVGLGWRGICDGARAFRWDASTGLTTVLPVEPNSTQSRANGVSRDGKVIFGFRVGFTGFREAAIWTNNVYRNLSTDAYTVGEALGATSLGDYVVGGAAGPNAHAWIWNAKTGLKDIGSLPRAIHADATAVSTNGSVVVGQSTGFFFGVKGFIWTKSLGMMNLNDFLATQGTFIDPSVKLAFPGAISANGRRIAGAGVSNSGLFAWYVDLNSVSVCAGGRTIQVSFPEGLDSSLAAGAKLGRCERLAR